MLQGLDSCSTLTYLVTLLLLSVVPAAAMRSIRDTMYVSHYSGDLTTLYTCFIEISLKKWSIGSEGHPKKVKKQSPARLSINRFPRGRLGCF